MFVILQKHILMLYFNNTFLNLTFTSQIIIRFKKSDADI